MGAQPQVQQAPQPSQGGGMASEFWNAAGMPQTVGSPPAPTAPAQSTMQQPFANTSAGLGSSNQKIMNAFNPMAGMQQQIAGLQQQPAPQAPTPHTAMQDDFWNAAGGTTVGMQPGMGVSATAPMGAGPSTVGNPSSGGKSPQQGGK